METGIYPLVQPPNLALGIDLAIPVGCDRGNLLVYGYGPFQLLMRTVSTSDYARYDSEGFISAYKYECLYTKLLRKYDDIAQ